MTRNASTAAARKERGEERSKAKWMKEAHKNRKRAEEAELQLAELRLGLLAGIPSEQVLRTSSLSSSDSTEEQCQLVSRSEFDTLRSELNQLRESYDKVTEMNKIAHNNRAMAEAELELAKESIRQLHVELTKSRSAETIARALYKSSIEKIQGREEGTAMGEHSETGTSMLRTPRNSNLVATSKSFSPITLEQLDFTDSSPGTAIHSPGGSKFPSCKIRTMRQSITDFLSGILQRLFGWVFWAPETVALMS